MGGNFVKRARWILVFGLAALLIGGRYGVITWANHPLGQELTLQTPGRVTPTDSVQSNPIQATATTISLEEKTEVITTIPRATQTTTPAKAAKICGNTGRMRLLVMGLTTPTKEEVLGADAIRLVSIDFDKASATILSLPALLWVDSHALDDPGVNQNPLTMVFTKAYMAAKDDPDQVRKQKATQALAQSIIDNFGYVPDHYIAVEDHVFVRLVDTLGGVEVTLPKAVDGTSEKYGIYPAGMQLLDGKRALNFARLFHPNGMTQWDVWGNQERQNIIVKAILAAVLKPQNWTKIPTLMNDVHQSVSTDLSLSQTFSLACMAQKVGKNARMVAVAENMVKMDSEGRMIADPKAIRNLVADLDKND